MNVRTPFQETLLGDDAGSTLAWTLWRQGYERGVESGYALGVAEGDRALASAAEAFLDYTGPPSKGVALERIRLDSRGAGEQTDSRTGAQLVADAHASWAELDRKDEAA